MNKKKLVTLLGTLTLVAVIGVGATLAYFTDNAEATNVVTMGHVDITLTENEVVVDPETGDYVQDPDDTAITEDGLKFDDIVPGETIPKNPTITVAEDSEDAYIRAKVEFEGLTEEQITELLAGISFEEGWTKVGDYYYYADVVTAGTEVVLFDEVTIPHTWGNEVADLQFNIVVSAEAIQADNLADDFFNEDGSWNINAEEIETYTKVVDAE